MALTILNGPWRFQPQGFKRRRPLTYKSTVKLVSGGAAIHLAGQGAQMNEAPAEGGKEPIGIIDPNEGYAVLMCDGYRALKLRFDRDAQLAVINRSRSFGTNWLPGVPPTCQNYTWPSRAPVDVEPDSLGSSGILFVFDDLDQGRIPSESGVRARYASKGLTDRLGSSPVMADTAGAPPAAPPQERCKTVAPGLHRGRLSAPPPEA